jgi:uncharacterized protein
MRLFDERLAHLRELEARREAVIAGIAGHGKRTAALAALVDAADSKQTL